MQIILPDKSSRIISKDNVPIREILLDLGFAPSGVIVIKNGSVVPDDLIAGDDDEIRIIKIAHGG
ncbi:MAG: MoaD/ThiS family protein [Methanospirillaceae archaeon]|nr:MoaD/ThiS family protein [Methanospirillaceae archaeon]